MECTAPSEHFFPVPELQGREPGWYGPQVRALEEEPLCEVDPGVEEAYRFLWLRTFHPAVAVRVEKRGEEYVLTGKRLSGEGGYEPGRLVVNRTVRLRPEQWRRFTALLDSARFWSPETETGDAMTGSDGAQWILEGVRGGRYRATDRWTAQVIDAPEPHFLRANLYLLDLAGLRPDSVLVY